MVAKRKYTIWYLDKDDFDDIDSAWCNWFDIKPIIRSVFNLNEWIGYSIRLITESETQAAMIKFKYEYCLINSKELFLTPSEYDELIF